MSIPIGGSATVNYTVNLASGNTWGTNLVVANYGALSQDKITASASNPMGDPPFSGTLTILTSPSAAAGSYQIILTATGDDPSTANATIYVTLASQSTTSTAGTGQSTAASTSVASTGGYGNGSSPYGGASGTQTAEFAVAIIVILIIAGYLMVKMSSMGGKLIVLGIALILLGIVVWLYADFVAYGNMAYLWGGVIAILLGTIIWTYADWKGGAFVMKKKPVS